MSEFVDVSCFNFPLQAQLLCECIHNNTVPDELWHQAVALARREEAVGLGGAGQPAVAEIVAFAGQFRPHTGEEEKYRLLATRTLAGVCWYDVILGFRNDALFKPVGDFLDNQSVHGLVPWARGLDVGTGTGNSLRAAAFACEQICGIDTNAPMLHAAQESGLPVHARLCQARAGKIPFPCESFDVSFSHGLTGYLDYDETALLAAEVSRTLTSGGVYLETRITRPPADVALCARGLLIDMLAMTAVGPRKPNMASYEEQILLFMEAGLDYFQVASALPGCELMVFTKR